MLPKRNLNLTRRFRSAVREQSPTKIYKIRNTQTCYTLFEHWDLRVAKHIFYHIPRRKNGDIVLMNSETGEILKIKSKKNQ